MKVRLTGRVNKSGASGCHEAGTVLDLDTASAERLIGLGVAERVLESRPRAVKPEAVKAEPTAEQRPTAKARTQPDTEPPESD